MTRDIKMVEDAIKGGGARQMQGRGARRKANRGEEVVSNPTASLNHPQVCR